MEHSFVSDKYASLAFFDECTEKIDSFASDMKFLEIDESQCNYMVPFFLCILIFYVFGEDAYVSKDNIIGFSLLLFLYGWSSIPLMYPTTYLFSIPSSAFVALACLNVFIGIVTTLSTYILELFTDKELQDIAVILKQVYLIFPHYCLGRGLMDLYTNQFAYETLASFGITLFRNPLSWDFLGKNLIYLALQGIIYFSITLLIEYKFFIRKRNFPILPTSSEVEDDDVALERSKVLGGHCSNAVLRMESLTKVYKPGQYPAVNQLCVAVQPGECFGLLGMNEAGKTTTFKMLTGNTSITSGNAYIAGHSIKTDIDNARQSIGYCPQFDALDSHLTGYEHLEFYARLRGIPEKHVRKIARKHSETLTMWAKIVIQFNILIILNGTISKCVSTVLPKPSGLPALYPINALFL